jgi:hypothetical protein
MTADPELAAVSGIVDDRPEVRGLVSVYRGLLEHFAMRRGTGAHVLRTSCGALRRSAFEAAELFDEWHMFSPSATVHDLEMGARLAAHERSVTRNTEVRVTSLRSWTLWRMLKSDFRDRGVLLMRTIDARARGRLRAVSLSHGAAPAEGFVCAGVVAALAWLASGFTPLLHAALGLVIAGLVLDLPLFGFVVRRRGLAFALAALPVHLLAQVAHGFGLMVGWAASHLIGKPRPDPTTQAYAEVGVRTWPPLPRLR